MVRSVVVIVLCLLIGAAAGLAWTRAAGQDLHRVDPRPGRADQHRHVARRPPVARRARSTWTPRHRSSPRPRCLQRAAKADPTLAKQSVPDLVKHTAITVPPNSVVLDIAFTASTPKAAQAGANAIGSGLPREPVRERHRAAGLADSRPRRPARVRAPRRSTSSPRRKPATPRTPRSGGCCRARSNSSRTRSRATAICSSTLGAIQITPGTTLATAPLPTSPSSPSKIIGLASGLGLGLLLGLLLAWLLNRFRRRVRRPEDIAQVVDLNTIAVLPNLEKGGALSEPYRRVALITTSAVRNADRIVFTTPAASPSGSRVATGVAAALLRGGTPVGAAARQRPRDRRPPPARARPDHACRTPTRSPAGTASPSTSPSTGCAAGASCSSSTPRAPPSAPTRRRSRRSPTPWCSSSTPAPAARCVRAAVRALDEVGAPMLGVVLVRSGLRRPKVGRGRDADADYDVLDPPTAWRMPAPRTGCRRRASSARPATSRWCSSRRPSSPTRRSWR